MTSFSFVPQNKHGRDFYESFFILSDDHGEAKEYAESIGIERINKAGECPCGCGLTKYKVKFPEPTEFNGKTVLIL